jgi:hypothetical protein
MFCTMLCTSAFFCWSLFFRPLYPIYGSSPMRTTCLAHTTFRHVITRIYLEQYKLRSFPSRIFLAFLPFPVVSVAPPDVDRVHQKFAVVHGMSLSLSLSRSLCHVFACPSDPTTPRTLSVAGDCTQAPDLSAKLNSHLASQQSPGIL